MSSRGLLVLSSAAHDSSDAAAAKGPFVGGLGGGGSGARQGTHHARSKGMEEVGSRLGAVDGTWK